MTHLYTFCRYLAALLIMFYGFSKLNGAQFTVLESELDKPLREVSGFWLSWYYFGYSWFYGNLIALAQIGGGLLLMFRRTTLLGAFLLLGMTGNIVLINVFYGVDFGGLVASLIITVLLAVIVAHHAPQLLQIFWTEQNPVYTEDRPSWTVPIKIAVCSAIILVPAVATYYIAHHNNRLPTPLDGRWEVLEASGGYMDMDLPTHIYFERNRAHMAVLRYPDQWHQHHFDVDTTLRRLSIYDAWLSRGDRIFEGEYRIEGPFLNLDGYYYDVPISIDLMNLDPPEPIAFDENGP